MEQTILEELKTGAKTTGHLKDKCGCDYPVLFTELSRLVEESKIEHFMTGDPIALHYKLGTVRPAHIWNLLPKAIS